MNYSYPKTMFFFVIIFFFYGPLNAKADCGANGRICTKTLGSNDLDYVVVRYYYITSATTTFETVQGNSPTVTDTTMHLQDPSTGNIVCSDDDGGSGLLSKIVVGQCPNFVYHKTYALLIHSYNEASAGKCDLHYNGSLESANLPVGGKRWDVTLPVNESVQVANYSKIGDSDLDTFLIIGTNPPSNPNIYVRADDDSGINRSPKVVVGNLPPYSGSGIVLVGRYTFSSSTSGPTSGTIKIYRNDAIDSTYDPNTATSICFSNTDSDCDGLGNQLENELKTCACTLTSTEPNCWLTVPHCQVTHNARDTDGDGIPDSWEVFGRGVSYPVNDPLGYDEIELSRFGADPRHKDVFVEIDWAQGKANEPPNGTAISASNITNFFKAFELGTSQDLENPDGLNGIRFHFDIKGTTNTLHSSGSSYGDWGGSSSIPAGSSTSGLSVFTELDNWLSYSRRGIFRYVIVDSRVKRSHAGVADLGMNMANDYPSVLVHEMGHLLGLRHGGETSRNCKPNYKSIMNYAHQYDYDKDNFKHTFSKGNLPDVNMSNLKENIDAMSPTSLPSSEKTDWLTWLDFSMGYYVDLNSSYVNWNKSGTIAGQTVTPTWQTSNAIKFPIVSGNYECNSQLYNKNYINIKTDTATKKAKPKYGPGLVSYQNKLYMFYISNSQKITYKTYAQGDTLWSLPIQTAETSESTPIVVKFSVKIPPATSFSEKIIVFYVKKVNNKGQIHMSYLENSTLQNMGNISSNIDVYMPNSDDYPPSVIIDNGEIHVLFRDVNKKLHRRIVNSSLAFPPNSSIQEIKVDSTHIASDIPPVLFTYGSDMFMYYKKNNSIYRAIRCTSSISGCQGLGSNNWKDEKNYGNDIDIDDNQVMSLTYLPSADTHYLYHIDKSSSGGMLAAFINRQGSLDFFNTEISKSIRAFILSIFLEYQFSPLTISKKIDSVHWNGGIHLVIFEYDTTEVNPVVRQEYHPYAAMIDSDDLKDWNDWKIMAKKMCPGLLSAYNTYGIYGPGNICQP